MSARLSPLNQPNAAAISLQRPVQLVGRHPECDVRIDQPRISRRHCCIALAYERVLIRDLGSRNGVRVNGVAVEEATLHHGDEVAIGPLLFVVELPAPVAVAVKAPVKAVPAPAVPSYVSPSDSDLIPLDL